MSLNETEIIDTIKANIPIKQLVVNLLNCSIERNRLKNDIARAEDVMKNQGAIQEMKRILYEIEANEEDCA